jgi:hypothetical protein
LYKIITRKDEVIVGLNEAEMEQYGGDANGLAQAILLHGSLPLWQYAVTRNEAGDLALAPRQKASVLATDSLRIEPYSQAYPVLPHQ